METELGVMSNIKLPENLFKEGFISPNNVRKMIGTPLDLPEIGRIEQWICYWLSPSDKMNTEIDSYGLKHICENAIGSYVCNGEFIAAMILSGKYKYKQDYINCTFNISKQSVREIRAVFKNNN